jgi:hypothetical protein
MKKDELKGKYVHYLDGHKKFRTGKVVNIVGRTLTVQNVLKEKTRIHPDKTKIIGVIRTRRKTSIKDAEEIEWK